MLNEESMDIIDDLRSLRNRLIDGTVGAASGPKGWNDDIELLDRVMEELEGLMDQAGVSSRKKQSAERAFLRL